MNKLWKLLGIVLVFYTIIAGLLLPVPRLPILHETIRNLYYHVTMWFSMIFLLGVSVYYSIKYLSTPKEEYDIRATEAATVGVFLGILGLVTGSLWARFTWGAWWVNDTKLNGAAAAMLVYFAYFILRSSIEDEEKRGRVAAVYSIFAFTMMFVFIMVLPRLTDSLHPGNGGNPGFSKYDLDNNMRVVFYPAIIGWILMGLWFYDIRVRMAKIREQQNNLS